MLLGRNFIRQQGRYCLSPDFLGLCGGLRADVYSYTCHISTPRDCTCLLGELVSCQSHHTPTLRASVYLQRFDRSWSGFTSPSHDMVSRSAPASSCSRSALLLSLCCCRWAASGPPLLSCLHAAYLYYVRPTGHVDSSLDSVLRTSGIAQLVLAFLLQSLKCPGYFPDQLSCHS